MSQQPDYPFFRCLHLASSVMQNYCGEWDRLRHAFGFLQKYGFITHLKPERGVAFTDYFPEPSPDNQIPKEYWGCLAFDPDSEIRIYRHMNMALLVECKNDRADLFIYAFDSPERDEDLFFNALCGLYKVTSSAITRPSKFQI